MSSYSNAAATAKANAAAYTQSLLDKLGERKALEVLAESPSDVRSLLESVDDAALRRPEREGKWSMLQVAQHLADVELVVGFRYRMPVAEDNPSLQGYDQDLWVQRLWRGDETVSDVLAQFEDIRAANLRFLRRLRPEEWERAGMHAERGRETVRHTANLAAGHDLVHRAQMRRVRDAVR
jgi:hypothetical protein